MGKMSYREKQDIQKLFGEDLYKIQSAMNKNINEYWEAVKDQVVSEIGIKEKLEKVNELEKKIERDKLELARIREEMQHNIASAERQLVELRRTAVGEYSGPPDPQQLQELNLLSHDKSIEDRKWFGFKIVTKLDAAIAIRLRASADIGQPIAALEGVAKAIERELAFASTHEQAYAAFKKFQDLGFREMGVELTPLLENIKGVSGQKLLEASIVADTTRLNTQALPAGDAQTKNK